MTANTKGSLKPAMKNTVFAVEYYFYFYFTENKVKAFSAA